MAAPCGRAGERPLATCCGAARGDCLGAAETASSVPQVAGACGHNCWFEPIWPCWRCYTVHSDIPASWCGMYASRERCEASMLRGRRPRAHNIVLPVLSHVVWMVALVRWARPGAGHTAAAAALSFSFPIARLHPKRHIGPQRRPGEQEPVPYGAPGWPAFWFRWCKKLPACASASYMHIPFQNPTRRCSWASRRAIRMQFWPLPTVALRSKERRVCQAGHKKMGGTGWHCLGGNLRPQAAEGVGCVWDM